MLRILGSSKRLCDGVSRRDFLQAGSLGLLGMAGQGSLGIVPAVAAAADPARGTFGRA